MEGVDPRLVRLLGGEGLAALRLRLRRKFERGESSRDGPWSVQVRNEDEYAALAGLLGLPPRAARSVRIDVPVLDGMLRDAGIASSLRAALEGLDGPIVDRGEERARIDAAWRAVVAGCESPLRDWLADAHALGMMKRMARHDAIAAARLGHAAGAVLQRLPATGVARAKLAAEVLGDAHALDNGQAVAALVLAVLRQGHCAGAADGAMQDAPEGATERRRATWARAGVLVNELARPVLCLNLPGAGRAGEPSWLSLRQLVREQRRWPVEGRAVFVCENPNLVAMAADALGPGCAPLVCVEGMPAAAQRTLLLQLREAGAVLRYHGDFDWPGIAIGNHVMRSFGATAWRFGAGDYEAALLEAARPGLPLTRARVEASWDEGLAAAMAQGAIAIAEEALGAAMFRDLAA